jgi:hypothetical protein
LLAARRRCASADDARQRNGAARDQQPVTDCARTSWALGTTADAGCDANDRALERRSVIEFGLDWSANARTANRLTACAFIHPLRGIKRPGLSQIGWRSSDALPGSRG